MQVLWTVFSKQSHFLFCGCHLARLITVNSRAYLTDHERIATMCYDTLSIVNAEVYWMIWWSATKCQIETEMITVNSYRHGLYLWTFIIVPHCLKMLFHFNNCYALLTQLYVFVWTCIFSSYNICCNELSTFGKDWNWFNWYYFYNYYAIFSIWNKNWLLLELSSFMGNLWTLFEVSYFWRDLHVLIYRR
jgi:hypothetical protein